MKSRVIAAAKAYIADLEQHEGAEGFSESTEKLRGEWLKELDHYRSARKQFKTKKKELI